MKHNQSIRLAIFLISFAVFLFLPVHQYWMLEYTKGHEAIFAVTPLTCDEPGCLAFRCVENTAPAGNGATDLGRGFVYVDLSGETARFSGVAETRKAVPDNLPYLIVRDLKLTPDGNSYQIPLDFHYFAPTPADAANLRMSMVKARSVKLKVEIYPNGDSQVKEVIYE